jgi:hypothetical protein
MMFTRVRSPFFLLLIVFLTCFLNSREVNAQKWLGVKPLNDTISEEKKGFLLVPLVYYSPDTRWAAGAAGVYYFTLGDSSQTTRLSYFKALADYTQNRQIDVWGEWNIFTGGEKYLFKGEVRYRNFPDRFYGIGNDSPKEAEEFYSYDYISFKTLQLRQVRPHLFVGFDYHFEYEYNFTYRDAEGQLASGTVPGYKGGTGSALGLVTVFDSRDNVVNAYRGRYFEFSTYLFEPLWGSTFDYFRVSAIHQQYFQFPNRHVLAIQQVANFNFGQVPFLDMSTVGSEVILRGYPKNRFRDKHFLATQAEYRFPIFWRFGGVAFAGIGDVFETTSDLRADRLKYSIGTGLRFLMNPKERLNIRFDYGIGREGGYYYFSVTESF